MPGTADDTLSVLVMARSVLGTSVSTSVALLSPGDVSVTVAGTAAVAVLVSEPIAEALIATVTTYVNTPPDNRLTELLSAPLPDTVHDDPALAVHVQFMEVAPTGSASVIVAPLTTDGPALLTVTVYVVFVPGVADVVPSDLATMRLAWATMVVVSVALLSAGSSIVPGGAVTVAVFDNTPVNAASTVPVTVNVADVPDGRSTVALTLPGVGPGLSQWPVPEAAHVELALVSPAGSVSVTAASITADGPELTTVTV